MKMRLCPLCTSILYVQTLKALTSLPEGADSSERSLVAYMKRTDVKIKGLKVFVRDVCVNYIKFER